MEYLTVRETSEKWGMSIRMVNYYLNTGRIEGAVRKKSEWLIPYTAKSPLDIRKKADTKKSTKRKRNVNKCYMPLIATVYKGNIIKNLIMDCQSYTKYRPNETTGGIFVSWRRKEELPTGA